MANANSTARATATQTIGNVIYLPCSNREPAQKIRHYGRYPHGVVSFRGYRQQIGNIRVGDIAVAVTNTYPSVRGMRFKITGKVSPDRAREMNYKYDGDWFTCETLNGEMVCSYKGVLSDATCLPECCLLPITAISA